MFLYEHKLLFALVSQVIYKHFVLIILHNVSLLFIENHNFIKLTRVILHSSHHKQTLVNNTNVNNLMKFKFGLNYIGTSMGFFKNVLYFREFLRICLRHEKEC